MKNNSPEEMIADIRLNYGLEAPEVFSSMRQIRRESFAPAKYKSLAYLDRPISIGEGQTMSQPYTVAFMTHLLIEPLKKNSRRRVLEIGTGSGYQAAVLSRLFDEVYTIEIIESFCQKARETFVRLEIDNIFVKCASGEYGFPEKAPFDAIIITAGVKGKSPPQKLFDQLAEGGVLVAPVGKGPDKTMKRYQKEKDKFKKESFGKFHFVPFVKEDKN